MNQRENKKKKKKNDFLSQQKITYEFLNSVPFPVVSSFSIFPGSSSYTMAPSHI